MCLHSGRNRISSNKRLKRSLWPSLQKEQHSPVFTLFNAPASG
uniref:Uncharacterized protein n=1 Tax=Klebsiella pneumoniae TaxID=573 RepID=A0A0U2ZMK4_KLEPN|nr:hypothetical protein [Klebsiella pneumoniae]